MIATVPEISPDEVQAFLSKLAAKGISIPEPQSIGVEAGEDHDGDPVFFLTVTFGRQHKPEDIPWNRISPLIRILNREVFLRGGEQIPVIPEVRRLAERLPQA